MMLNQSTHTTIDMSVPGIVRTAVKLKICGLFRQEDITFANLVRPDYIGFVFWEKSRRRVDREQAALLKRALDPGIPAVGVFVNESVEKVTELLEEGVIDLAQLHGDETEEEIQAVKALTAKPVIKAVRVRSRRDVEAWLDSSADYLLFDSGMGSGVPFDWRLLDGVKRAYVLAGGLNADNIGEALGQTTPWCVDISSGVETDGRKDLEKIKVFKNSLIRQSAGMETES